MKILITGATGLIGGEIIRLRKEHNYKVHYLTTNKKKIKNDNTSTGFYWNPESQQVDVNCLDGVDAIINLAGASIAKRWTPSYKREILESRVLSIKLLRALLSENKHQVKSVVSASAIGIYPSSYSQEYTEDEKEINPSFLGKVVSEWEQEVDTLKALNIKVCKVRIGIVLAKNGGALDKMIKPIKMGIGALLGNGKQYQSWIHSKDLARLFLFVAENKLNGIYNAVASNPVTNKELVKSIGKQLRKSIWLPNVPAFVLKFLLREMAAIILESQKVSNIKILNAGFEFIYNSIDDALNEILK